MKVIIFKRFFLVVIDHVAWFSSSPLMERRLRAIVQAVYSSCTAIHTRDIPHSTIIYQTQPPNLAANLSCKNFPSLPLSVRCHCCPASVLLPLLSALPPPQYPPAGSGWGFKIFTHHSLISLCAHICGE